MSGCTEIGNGKASRDVKIQDQFTEIVDVFVSQFLSEFTLTAPVASEALSATGTVEAGFVPVVGQMLCLKEGIEFLQVIITSRS